MDEYWDKVILGLIPWSEEGFTEANHKLEELAQTPNDDWDLREHKTVIEIDGRPVGVALNMFKLLPQFAAWITKRYPREQGAAYGHRFRVMMDFLHENEERLVQEGLLKVLPDGNHDSTDGLIRALSELPFEEPVDNPTSETQFFRFSYAQVVARAKEREG